MNVFLRTQADWAKIDNTVASLKYERNNIAQRVKRVKTYALYSLVWTVLTQSVITTSRVNVYCALAKVDK